MAGERRLIHRTQLGPAPGSYEGLDRFCYPRNAAKSTETGVRSDAVATAAGTPR